MYTAPTLSLRVPCLLFYCRRLFTHVTPSPAAVSVADLPADRGGIWAEASSAPFQFLLLAYVPLLALL